MLASLVLSFSNMGSHPAAQMARCSMGFLVSVVWIMAIADEVVNVLQVTDSNPLSNTRSRPSRHLGSYLVFRMPSSV